MCPGPKRFFFCESIYIVFVGAVEIDFVFVCGLKNIRFWVCTAIDLVFVWVVEVVSAGARTRFLFNVRIDIDLVILWGLKIT